MIKPERSNISKLFLAFFLLIFLFEGVSSNGVIADPIFIPAQEDLIPYYDVANSVLIASTGRSGSTILLDEVFKCAPKDWILLKTHILPPKKSYRGKIIFIFSNPDKAAESALHITIDDCWSWFGQLHFNHLESSDKDWLNMIGGEVIFQTEQHNLLAYDALGSTQQLACWLYCRTLPCDRKHAQILAVKYENLWEPATLQAIRDFLSFDDFALPPYIARGAKLEQLSVKERWFRTLYNLGTEEEPRYEAYDEARWFWKNAPPFQFLGIN
jgi:hypothetical protein